MSRLAYRIDPAARTVEALRFDGLPDIYAAVGTPDLDHSAMRRTDGGFACVWVDDQGYYKRGLKWWRLAGFPEPFAGPAMITGADQYGEDDDLPLTLTQMAALVSWVDGIPPEIAGFRQSFWGFGNG